MKHYMRVVKTGNRKHRPYDAINAANAKRWGLAHGYRGDKGGWIYDKNGQHTAHGWNEFYYFIGPTRIDAWLKTQNLTPEAQPDV